MVLKELDNKNINYLVIDNDEIIINKSFNDNNYISFIFDKTIINYNLIMINKIIKYLNDNLFNNKTNEKIMDVINE